MARAAFEIAGQSVAPGTVETVTLPVSSLPDHTPIGLQVQIHHGKRAGPTMFVSAAVHGDEVIGVEIVRRLLRTPQLESLRGTMLVVPIENAYGYMEQSRY